ncbi:MAG: hypothetical protein ACI3XI_07800 [Eubacteriales bacterium]
MKKTIKIMAFLLVLAMLIPCVLACRSDEPPVTGGGTSSPNNTSDDGSEPLTPPELSPIVTAPEEGDKIYNIIFALATVPPVLAALDCIASGYPTYAIIERGKTYNGIDKIENFHNAGFDTSNNLSTGFTAKEFTDMAAKVKELREADENSFFYFYAQDGTALRCAAIAANAGIPAEDFHIYMCEDGTGAYVQLKEKYIDGKTANLKKDEPYDEFIRVLDTVGSDFSAIMSKRDNKNSDEALKYNIQKAFALSVLPNFTYWLQDRSNVESILSVAAESKLPGIFGITGFENKTDYIASLRYQTISQAISELTDEQRSDYLTLMYGDYYEATYEALTRTERAGRSAPSKKLVYIGTRHGLYPKFASDAKYGIGGLAKTDTVPESYSALPEKYKNALLFKTEADYNAFLAVLNNASVYPADAPNDVIAEIKAACFNLYIDYIFSLKFTYLLYGSEYDIIMKGHPREVIGAYGEWGKRYNVVRKTGEGDNQTEVKYCYDRLIDTALLSFHANDSVGKLIGMVPYGTAAENLAYLGADIAICGLPSSTYSGYDLDVDVLFIAAETDEAIDGDFSQVKDRYNAGNLTYSRDGEEVSATYYNIGNTYKYAAQLLKSAGDTSAAATYETLYKSWLSANRSGASDIDAQGFAK